MLTRLVIVVAVLAAGGAEAPPPSSAAPPGQAAAPVRLTLDEAMARAVAASHRIGEGQARQEAATAAVDARGAATMPTVSVMAGYMRTNHTVPFGLPPEQPTAIIYSDIPDNWRTRVDMRGPSTRSGDSSPWSARRAAKPRPPSRTSPPLRPTSASTPTGRSGRWSRPPSRCAWSRRR